MRLPTTRATWGRTLAATAVLSLALVPAIATADDDRDDRDDRRGDRDAPSQIVLPGADSAEGIAAGQGDTFYAGEISSGDVFRGDVRTGAVERFVDAPDGRAAIGLSVDLDAGLLLVAGGPTGQAYAYDLRTGEAVDAVTIGQGFVNDVDVVDGGAWFTNSRQAVLTFVPTGADGFGDPVPLRLSGPAADTDDAFNLNGIAALPGGRTLLVAHSGNGEVVAVDAGAGTSRTVARGLTAPDGILLDDEALHVVENAVDRVTTFEVEVEDGRVELEREARTTDPAFNVPTTVAAFDDDLLAVVNAQFGDADDREFEVVPFEVDD